jgi:hypothetical protein
VYDRDVATRVLVIGLPAGRVFAPGLDQADLDRRIDVGRAAVAAAGFDATQLLVDLDPAVADAELRAALATGPFAAAMIGGGIRAVPANTALFERLVNTLRVLAPAMPVCFNTGPETTVDALHRVLSP